VGPPGGGGKEAEFLKLGFFGGVVSDCPEYAGVVLGKEVNEEALDSVGAG
jgi:hypothetical protein